MAPSCTECLHEICPSRSGAHTRARHIDERHVMSSTQAAVVLGASGSVGNALIQELIRTGSFKPIVTLVRRSQPDQVAIARDAGVELRETRSEERRVGKECRSRW